MEGQGRLTLTDNSYYECSWHLGQPQKGKWYSADGKTEYEGQFKGMLWHGFGIVHQTGVRKYMGKATCLSSHAASLHCSLSAAKQQTVKGALGSANSSYAAMIHLCNALMTDISNKAWSPRCQQTSCKAVQLCRHAVHAAMLTSALPVSCDPIDKCSLHQSHIWTTQQRVYKHMSSQLLMPVYATACRVVHISYWRNGSHCFLS